MSIVDPVTLQVIQARLAGIVQEMQNSLFRTGYPTETPNKSPRRAVEAVIL